MSVLAVALALTVVALAQVQAARVRAAGLAAEAARAGVQHIDLTAYRTNGRLVLQPGLASTAAEAHLAAAGATGTATVTGNRITVTATSRQSVPLLTVFGLGGQVTVTATAAAQPYTADPIGGP
ncbi:hypothetical protein ACFQY4_18075 [Catellatospora bangladeshensis]|nr:hypothetical protein [Catellatospora bangladeshensis]